MKKFIQRKGRINYYSNVFVTLLCTSYLFTGYGIYVDNDVHHVETAKVIENDMEEVSQTGKKGEVTTKVTAVVTKKEVNSSNKVYTPAKYNEVTGNAIVTYAKKYLGLRYESGGYSLETGTDCSGFTKLIYQEFGINLPRAVKSQVNSGTYIKKSDLQKGDLVFYGYGDSIVHHVAIYIGNGQVIHESTRQDGVKISSVNMMQYLTARRVINDTANAIALEKSNNENVASSQENEDIKKDDTATEDTTTNDNSTTDNSITNQNNNVATNEESSSEIINNGNDVLNNNNSVTKDEKLEETSDESLQESTNNSDQATLPSNDSNANMAN